MRVRVKKTKSLEGKLSLPGDKSLSHRALLFSALAEGKSTFSNLGPGADIRSTATCLRGLGVHVVIDENGNAEVEGVGLHGLQNPSEDLDCGNSGTSIRLLSGVVAGAKVNCRLIGDEGLSKRPMARVLDPLARMNATVKGTQQGEKQTPPLQFIATAIQGFSHKLPIASAQVKSCLLLAGLFAEGATSVLEPHLSRDHTERMLLAQGAPIKIHDDRSISISLPSNPLLPFAETRIPGDPSSAAFFAVAASLVQNASIRLENASNNKTRVGFLRVLERMGATLEIVSQGESLGDEVCDIVLQAPQKGLMATNIGGDEIPSLVDEVPILAVLATQCEGTTIISGAKELRVKECDRISAMVQGLQKMGADVEEQEDGMIIHGPTPLKGGVLNSLGDHRIAMSFAVAGLVAETPVIVEEAQWACISYPAFFEELKALGADCEVIDDD
ncbi:MAG: 3-phosphoshikimate 1-carboxyvinyltransferase [Deltaproteobacteria bacterium]|nr:3-phosphoshikimate 1-carboxyvinyltransferase [Deltaproteobacteria bacterium]